MKPMESFVGQPVRSLQTMLRTIAQLNERQPSVIPDGIYGRQTAAAVSAFQRRNGLPVTGSADPVTWERIVEEFELARIETDPAWAVQINLDPGEILRRGQRDHRVYLLQSMLTVLNKAASSIPAPDHNGILDDATAAAVEAFQVYAGLPVTGEVDKRTWKNLALHFALAADYLENLEYL